MKQALVDIHPNAKIAENVIVGSFSVIEGDVEIGEGTWVGPNVTIMDGARIGKNCKIFPGAVISAIPQDLKFSGEYSTAVIGDNTTIRECVTVNRGTVDRNQTVIGKSCLLMAYTHVAHDCIIGDNCILANSVQVAGHVQIQDFAIIGGTSAIHQFVNIGKHSILAGGSLVNKDVPPFIKGAKYPTSYHGINKVGLRRRGYSADQIAEIQEIYRVIFLSGHNTSDALTTLKEKLGDSEFAKDIINFITSSKMGIIKSA